MQEYENKISSLETEVSSQKEEINELKNTISNLLGYKLARKFIHGSNFIIVDLKMKCKILNLRWNQYQVEYIKI